MFQKSNITISHDLSKNSLCRLCYFYFLLYVYWWIILHKLKLLLSQWSCKINLNFDPQPKCHCSHSLLITIWCWPHWVVSAMLCLGTWSPPFLCRLRLQSFPGGLHHGQVDQLPPAVPTSEISLSFLLMDPPGRRFLITKSKWGKVHISDANNKDHDHSGPNNTCLATDNSHTHPAVPKAGLNLCTRQARFRWARCRASSSLGKLGAHLPTWMLHSL